MSFLYKFSIWVIWVALTVQSAWTHDKLFTIIGVLLLALLTLDMLLSAFKGITVNINNKTFNILSEGKKSGQSRKPSEASPKQA